MNSKIDKKWQRNSNILEQWHVSITKYYVLSSKEAKQLMRLFLNEKDEKKKCEIRNVIVLGTLEYVYQFLKQSIFVHLICNWFDMEDVINATVEAWIKFISKEQINSRAHLYTIDSKYTLYSQTFLNCILSNLVGRDIFAAAGQFGIKELKNMTNWYSLYLKEKKNNPNLSLADFKNIIGNNYSDSISEDSLAKMFDIFKYCDHILKMKDTEINFETINSLKVLLFNLVNMATLENGLTWNEAIMIDRLLDHDLIVQIFGDYEFLTLNQREILYKLFVEGKNETRVAKEKNVSFQSVSDLKRRTLEKIKKQYQSWQSDID